MEGGLFGDSNLIAVVELFTAIAVVIGIVFGLIELRQATRSRRDHAGVDIVRTVQTQEVRAWVESERAVTQNVNVGEWCQWLYELLEANPDPGKKQGAHVAYRGRRAR